MARETDGTDEQFPVRDEHVESTVREIDRKFRQMNHDILVSRDVAARAFQVRLQAAVDAKGWNNSDLARACTIVSGKHFGRDRIHTYLRSDKAHMPRRSAIITMAQALGIDGELLYPSRERVIIGTDRHTPMAEFKDRGDGTASLHVNQVVDYNVALKILALLKGQDDDRVS